MVRSLTGRLNVDADNAATAEQIEYRREIIRASAFGGARFDEDVGGRLLYDLLVDPQILLRLLGGYSEPESVLPSGRGGIVIISVEGSQGRRQRGMVREVQSACGKPQKARDDDGAQIDASARARNTSFVFAACCSSFLCVCRHNQESTFNLFA